MRRRVLFLPGALGAPGFWHAVGARLPETWETVYLGWPGLGAQPPDPEVRGFDDLVRLVERALGGPCDLVAQSMGGVVALRTALAHPRLVRRLVLVATSGGLDTGALGAADWRETYRATYPGAAAWATAERPDLTEAIPALAAPTLLVFGDADPVAPVAVGERLRELLPDARLRVLPGGTHDLALDRADEVARLVAEHLA